MSEIKLCRVCKKDLYSVSDSVVDLTKNERAEEVEFIRELLSMNFLEMVTFHGITRISSSKIVLF